VLHTSAGYLLGTTMTSHYVFDLKDTDVYWCTADIGWITGHSYVVYGPLSCGATVLMYEAPPTSPSPTASGRSSTSTVSPFSTRARPPIARSCAGATTT